MRRKITPPAFEIFPHSKKKRKFEGCFNWGEERRKYDNDLDPECPDWDKLYQRTSSVIRADPYYIEAYLLRGYLFFESEDYSEAINEYARAIKVCEQFIPKSFDGQISWVHLGNRPYIRALHGFGLACLKLGKRQEAIEVFEKMLRICPSDNLGARLLLGHEYYRTGRFSKAKTIFEKNFYYPPYQYTLGLLLFNKGDYVAAATTFRLAFLKNVYIAELICGKKSLYAHIRFHANSDYMPEIAREYWNEHPDLWRKNPRSIAFVRWLFDQGEVQIEKGRYFSLLDRRTWEQAISRLSDLTRQITAVEESIDDKLSKALIVEVQNRQGERRFPWEFDKF